MTTFTHIISGSYIAVKTAGIDINQVDYIAAALASPAILEDIDHLYFLIKDRKFFSSNGIIGNLHKARSLMHELFGFGLIGFLMLIASFFNFKLAYVIGVSSLVHLAEDFIMGITVPFNPFDKFEMNLISQKKLFQYSVDIGVIVIFSILWLYLLIK
jgi:hypothetical protein